MNACWIYCQTSISMEISMLKSPSSNSVWLFYKLCLSCQSWYCFLQPFNFGWNNAMKETLILTPESRVFLLHSVGIIHGASLTLTVTSAFRSQRAARGVVWQSDFHIPEKCIPAASLCASDASPWKCRASGPLSRRRAERRRSSRLTESRLSCHHDTRVGRKCADESTKPRSNFTDF